MRVNLLIIAVVLTKADYANISKFLLICRACLTTFLQEIYYKDV